MIKLYVGSTNLIEAIGLKDKATGLYLSGATLTFTLRSSTLIALAGATNISMPALSGQGNYRGVLEHTVALVDGGRYYLDVTAVSGSVQGFWRIECIGAYKTE
jgi:hypothetical protein